MEGIKILKRPRLRKPCFIVAWPGMGEVAFKAATYLVEKLKAEEFASLSSEKFFYLTGSVIKNGVLDIPELPEGKFYYWKDPAKRLGRGKGADLIIFISNAQPDLTKAESYSRKIIQVARAFGVEMVISLASMPQPIDHTQKSGVWFAATSVELRKVLRNLNFNILPAGQVSGMNGLFLGLAKRAGLQGFCLLGEIPFYTMQVENPRASYAVLEALSKVLGIRINLSGLSDQAYSMETEIGKLIGYLKLGAQGQIIGPIGEEDIEEIKTGLEKFSKLPVSIKKKIEELFARSKSDIKNASGLKDELDKWNVYKEYEDRFLDLFKKEEGQETQ